MVIKSLILILISFPAYAYLGPGLGGGLIAATIGIVVALFAGIAAVVWFPLKRFFTKKNKKTVK